MSPYTGTDANTNVSAGQAAELSSVANALRVLELLAEAPKLGVSDVARRLELSKASASRLLSTLRSFGFVEQDADSRRYRLTLKIAVLAEHVRSHLNIVDVARPHLTELANDLHEGANLGVLLNGALVYADTIPSGHIFRIEVRPGTAVPAYCTGAGKVLLAHLGSDELDPYLEHVRFERHTSTTITDAAALRAELERVRQKGYAIDRGELAEESWCAAAPVRGRAYTVVAAVSVTAPKSRFREKRDAIVEHVVATAQAITQQFGAPD